MNAVYQSNSIPQTDPQNFRERRATKRAGKASTLEERFVCSRPRHKPATKVAQATDPARLFARGHGTNLPRKIPVRQDGDLHAILCNLQLALHDQV